MSIFLSLHREKERQTVHKTFEIPLDIPDVTIEKTETNHHGDIVITVQSTIEGTSCHQCGNRITKVYGYDREIIVRHLSIPYRSLILETCSEIWKFSLQRDNDVEV